MGRREIAIMVKPNEIYLIQAEYKYSHDQRPCIILEVGTREKIKLALISSAIDLYDASRHFLLDSRHPDFPESGLRRTSYIMKDAVVEAEAKKLGKKLGELKQQLAKDFEKWAQ